MSVIMILLGLALFFCGAFGLFSGLVENNDTAAAVRDRLSQLVQEPKPLLIAAGAALVLAGAALVVLGNIRAKREQKTAKVFSIRVLTVLAMLTAMAVMLDRFPGLSIKTAGWKIGFSFVPPMLAAMLYGPLEGALVYGLSDLIGALLFPFGPYHPGFTVVAALMGFIMGLFLNKKPLAFAKSDLEWKSIRFFPNMVLPVVINCLLLGLVVNTFWVAQLYGSKTYGGWFVYRLVEYAVLVPVQLIMIPVLLRLCTTLRRAGLAGRGRRLRPASEARLRDISRNESILGLERISKLLELMGHPEDATRIIHVAGTNGKGSFCAMLASILKEAGLRVGSFTSPALTGACDSFRIDGEVISDERLEELLCRIAPYADSMDDRPTEFEVMTAAAFLLFAEEGCSAAVVECGLGGAGDSTNALRYPVLSVITNVQLDHTDRLGSTLAQIAANKAGIIKQGRPVLYGGSSPEADEVIEKAAEERGSKLYRTDLSRMSVRETSLEGTFISFKNCGDFRLSLIGAYQPENAANVLTAVDLLRGMGFEISDEAVRLGLENVRWPARFEVLSREPVVIFDGSHNPDGVALAERTLGELFPNKKCVLLMGVMADKDHAKYPDLLRERAEKVFCVRPDNPRSLEPSALADEFLAAGVPAEAFEELEEGVRAAFEYASGNDLPMIGMGTLYMYKRFTEALNVILKKGSL